MLRAQTEADHVLAAVAGASISSPSWAAVIVDLGAADDAAVRTSTATTLSGSISSGGATLNLRDHPGEHDVDRDDRDHGHDDADDPTEGRNAEQGDTGREQVQRQPRRSMIVALAMPPPSHIVWRP